MKYLIISLQLILTATVADGQNLQSYVKPFIGTGGTGHTFPGACLPHGMVQLSPDTRIEEWESCAGYQYLDQEVLGFSHTHLSGTGVPDLCDLLIQPCQMSSTLSKRDDGTPYLKQKMDKSSEKASPGYYSVKLNEAGINVELTATHRTGWHRYQFSQADAAWIIDLQHRDKVLEAMLKQESPTRLSGIRISQSWAEKQYFYFVIDFSVPVSLSSIEGYPNTYKVNPKNPLTAPVIIKTGISATSIDGAKKNLNAEAPAWDFDAIKTNAESIWNSELGKIQIQTADTEIMSNFYTALYHASIAPCVWGDVDSLYRGMDGKVYKAKDFMPYTIFSLWDTYRAEHPLFTLIDRKRTNDYIKTMIDHFEKSQHLPVWELNGNETWCMIGYHSVSVIADAYVKGIRGFDAEKALNAMVASAKLNRFGIKEYGEIGYLPANVSGESVSKTLEYAYDDWCIGRMAQLMGKDKIATEFFTRSQSWKQLFDKKSGFMRPRYSGRFVTPFIPAEINKHYTEGNAWQYTWSVQHDVQGLINQFGGKEKMENHLDELFTTQVELSGRAQPDVTGLIGQYAHGNEPSHHIPYLYNELGKPWKTQSKVRQIMNTMYSNDPITGLSGNEDCGQMSAWYVLNAMGLYDLCPGSGYFHIGSPIVDAVTINLENGKKWILTAKNNTKDNVYIKNASSFGRPMTQRWLYYDEIYQGNKLEYEMSNQPTTNTLDQSDVSPMRSSKLKNQVVAMPYIANGEPVFQDKISVELACSEEDAKIFWKEDTLSKTAFKLYSSPIQLNQTSTISLYAQIPNGSKSRVENASFHEVDKNFQITVAPEPNTQYAGGGKFALVDGQLGGADYQNLSWAGWEGTDVEITIDFGAAKEFREISLGTLNAPGPWIFAPNNVEIQHSLDGQKYTDLSVISEKSKQNEQKNTRIKINYTSKKTERARYIKLKVNASKTIPEWHQYKGYKSWLFLDEIEIR